MKRITKLFFCIISVCVVFVSMCPITAFAVPDTYYQIASDKPTVTDYSGYAELLFEDKTTGQRFVTVLSWYFTPYINTSSEYYESSDIPIFTLAYNNTEFKLGFETNEYVSGNISFLTIDTGSQIYFAHSPVPDDEERYFYTVSYGSSYALVGIHYYGNFDKVIDSSAYDIGTEFYVTYGADSVISHGLNQVISGIYSLIDVVGNESYASQLTDILDKLNSIDTSVDDFHAAYETGLTQLFGWFQFFLKDLDSIVSNTDEIEEKIDGVAIILVNIENWVYYIYEYTLYIYEELLTVNSQLKSILDVLNAKGSFSENVTIYDNTVFDNLGNIENELYSQYDVDLNTLADFELNNQAMDVVWSITDTFINSHPKIMPIIIAVLVLGVIALILAR